MRKCEKKSVKKIDPKYIGVPNICFSVIGEKDKRAVEFKKQRLARGFDDSELWGLDCAIAKFIIPRLERFLEVSSEHIDGTVEGGVKVLEAMRLIVAEVEDCKLLTEADKRCVAQGLKIFSKIFQTLWY